MKQKKLDSFSHVINGIRLFRDDIEYIMTLLESNSLSPQLLDSFNIYENIDEIIKIKGNNPLELKIQGQTDKRQEWVDINVQKNKLYINASGSNLMYKLGIELKNFFNNKISWQYRFLNPLIFWYVFSFGIFTLLITYSSSPKNNWHLLLVLTTGFSFLAWLLRIVNSFFGNGVTLKRKHEYGFWKRNKDQIILLILGGVFGSLLTLLIQWITRLGAN